MSALSISDSPTLTPSEVDSSAMSQNPERSMTTAIAYLQSALNDGERYIELAPIDDRILRAVLVKYLVLFIAIKGPAKVDTDLDILRPYVKKLQFTERISEICWSNVVMTQWKSTWELVRTHYSNAAAEWDPILNRPGKATRLGKASERDAPDGLEDLVEALSLGPGRHELNTNEESWHQHAMPLHLDEKMLLMYEPGRGHTFCAHSIHQFRVTCTYCGSPSAQVISFSTPSHPMLTFWDR